MGQAKADVAGHGRHESNGCLSVAVALMMKSEVLPVIVPDGDNSSPSVPAGTGGPKSKSKWLSLQYSWAETRL